MRTPTIALMLAVFVGAPLAAQEAPAAPAEAPAPPTKAEIEARLAAAFTKYDVGEKDYLTIDEFHTMMEQEEGSADLTRSTAVHGAADADKNGELSLAEFTAFVSSRVIARDERAAAAPPAGARGGGDRRGQMVAQFEETWNRFDAGAKGYLTQDEFVAMMADIQTKMRIARVGSGETAGRGPRTFDPVEAEARSRASFVAADADKDGRLTQDELKAQFAARAGDMMRRRGGGSAPAGTDD